MDVYGSASLLCSGVLVSYCGVCCVCVSRRMLAADVLSLGIRSDGDSSRLGFGRFRAYQSDIAVDSLRCFMLDNGVFLWVGGLLHYLRRWDAWNSHITYI